MSSTRHRVIEEQGFVLHTYPWRETSLVVELWTREYGRLPLVAKGARRAGSALRGVLMAFQPLSVSWSGKSEVKTLTAASWQGGQPLLGGVGLLCGYYLNELLLRLLAREDAHPKLYDHYADTVARLARGEATAPLLRGFELALLSELGYGLTLDRLAGDGSPVQPGGRYLFEPEVGVVPAPRGSSEAAVLSGRTLLAMARNEYDDAEAVAQARSLMRRIIQHHLGGQPLESRRILMELNEL